MIIGSFALRREPERRELDRLEAIPRDDRRAAARGASRCRCRRGRGSACRRRACPPRRGRARTRARGAPPSSASRPNARSPMIGFAGFVWTSSTGAKSMSKPSARSSSPDRATDLLGDALVLAGRAARRATSSAATSSPARARAGRGRLLDRPRSAPACRRARLRWRSRLSAASASRSMTSCGTGAARDRSITRLRLNRIVAPTAPASRRARSAGGAVGAGEANPQKLTDVVAHAATVAGYGEQTIATTPCCRLHDDTGPSPGRRIVELEVDARGARCRRSS